jgi:SAM-dependent methyltransferase
MSTTLDPTAPDDETVDEAVDETAAEAFVGKALGDLAGTMAVLQAGLGDRLGLFRALTEAGPATAEELAARTAISPRYAREWLAGLTTAGYLSYDPAAGTWSVPPSHAAVVAQEDGPVFFGGVWDELLGMLPHLDAIADAFRDGGGVRPDSYGPTFWRGLERFTSTWFANQLLPVWIPALPTVERLLERGADVADVGCGSGRGLITLAQAYPQGRYVGYDAVQVNVDRARQSAAAAGVDHRVRFELADAAAGLPETYDVVFTFDVVHDSADPLGLLTAIRRALRPDGRYVCLDINASDRLEENVGQLGTLFYGFSVLHCMTSSLAVGGAGLGTCGFTESVAADLGGRAGFSEFRRVPVDNPFNILYEAIP